MNRSSKNERYTILARLSETPALKTYSALDTLTGKVIALTLTSQQVLLKRYHDLLSEGVPREALAELDALKTVPQDSSLQALSDVYTRG